MQAADPSALKAIHATVCCFFDVANRIQVDHPRQAGTGGFAKTRWAASCRQLSLALPLRSSKEGWGTLCKIKMQSGGYVKTKGVASVFAAGAD